MQWVEKASLEKIRRLLEVSKQECHCEVFLTLKNLADVRRSPTPYSLLIRATIGALESTKFVS